MIPDVYGIFVFLHVVSAVISIGPLFLLLPVIQRLRGTDSQTEEAYLNVIRVTIRLVMHAGHALSCYWCSPTDSWTLAMAFVMGDYDNYCFTVVCRLYLERIYTGSSQISRTRD